MRKAMFILGCLLFSTVLFGQKINDPNAEVRQASGYHGIDVSSAFDVYLDQSSDEAVAVSAATEKDRDLIRVEVRNGILHIFLDKAGWKWKSGNRKLKAYISFKTIDQIKISGACDVYVSGTIKADNLTIHQSGASDFRKGELDVNKLTVDLSGASDMHVTGKASQVSIEASGASSFKGFDLVTETCDIRASGASDVKITVNRELSAQASGASDIHYKGEGLIRDIRTSGSSSIKRSGS